MSSPASAKATAGQPSLASHQSLGLASPAVAREARRRLAGAAGFEPANAGTKNRCLTTWRRPSRRERGYIDGCRLVGRGRAPGSPRPHRASGKFLDPAIRVRRLAALDGDEALAD